MEETQDNNPLLQRTLSGDPLLARYPYLQTYQANAYVYLSPLQAQHEEALYAVASDPLIWAQHPNPERHTREGFKPFFEGALQSGAALLIRDMTTGHIIGTSRYYGPDAENNSIAIGYTFLSRSHWGGVYNQAVKTLMLDLAFTRYHQVQFHIGIQNQRSRKAIEKIGATPAGAVDLTHQGQSPVRSVVYQISRTDWQTRIRPDTAGETFRIRRASNADIDPVRKIVMQVLDEYGLPFDGGGVDYCLADLERYYHRAGGCFGVLIDPEDQIIGTVGVMNKGEGLFELKKMFILKEARGRGLGKMLMRFVFCFLHDTECTRLRLETKHELVEAIGLYLRFGFVEVPSGVQNDRIDMAFELKWK